MIQDIAPHTYHNEYKPVAPDKESHILAYEEGKILMKKRWRDYDSSKLWRAGRKKLKTSMRIISISSPLTKSNFYLIPDLDTQSPSWLSV
mgnify:CR=1 FL=1